MELIVWEYKNPAIEDIFGTIISAKIFFSRKLIQDGLFQ